MPMRFFALDTFRRLKEFITDCPAYDDTYLQQGAVFFSYNAWYTYIIVFVLAIYDRTMFHVMITTGLFVNAIAVWAVDTYLPFHAQSGAHLAACAQHTEKLVSPETAVCGFVAVFFLVWDVYNGSPALWVNTAVYAWLLFYVGLTCASLYIASLYRIEELYVGLTVGAATGAFFAILATAVVLPNWDTPLMGKVKWVMGVKKTRFRDM